MWFRLAKELGMSVGRAQAEIDSREFSEWCAYWNIEPFGEERADWRIAQLCCLVGNMFAGKGTRLKIRDFMLDTARKVKKTPQQMLSVMRSFVTAHNAHAKKGR